MKIEKVLVPVDGSQQSDAAVELTVASASKFNAHIDFVGLIDATNAANFGNVSEASSDMMAAETGRLLLSLAKDKAEAAKVDYSTQIVKGVPYKVLAELSADHDIMVMGLVPKGLFNSHVNSQAVKTIKNSKCPVLTLKSARFELRKILLAVYDGTEDSVDMAIAQAKASGAPLHIIAVYAAGCNADAAVAKAAERCKAAGIEADTETAKGNPVKIMAEVSKGYDLLVTDVEGHGKFTEDLMFKACCPVLIVGDWNKDAQRCFGPDRSAFGHT